MKKTLYAVLCAYILSLMLLCTVFAAVQTQTISLYPYQTYNYITSTRTGAYSYTRVGCNSVYPTSGADNYTQIEVRLVNTAHTQWISDTVTITEGTGLHNVYIYQGLLNISSFQFGFRYIDNHAAGAVVKYDPM